MGYGYGRNPQTGKLVLACDHCGKAEGKTRKRTCPHRVRSAFGGSLPYCPAPALCPPCYAVKKDTLHEACAAPAKQRTEEEWLKEFRFIGGDLEVKAAFGDWCPTVPPGTTGVLFGDGSKKEYRLVSSYDQRRWLSEYPEAQPWGGP